jgi:hypothetical protein
MKSFNVQMPFAFAFFAALRETALAVIIIVREKSLKY